jgi:NADPH2:quinone reductase
VFADGPVEGKTVLVTGGAGAAGFYAIQFAKHGGARVIATVSNDAQAQVARRAGADFVVNWRSEDVVARAAELTGAPSERSIDRIVEVAFGTNLDTSLRMLKPSGVIAAYSSDQIPEPVLPFWPLPLLDATVRFVLVFAMSTQAREEAVEFITDAARDGCSSTISHKRFRWSRSPKHMSWSRRAVPAEGCSLSSLETGSAREAAEL